MRVTMQTIHKNILSNLNKLTSDMNDLNNQISSGRQMSKISDNPVNLSVALSLRTNLSEIKQYQENLTYGTSRINAAESSLSQVKDLVSRAKVLAIQASNASQTPDNRAIIAKEVDNLFSQAITLGNTQLNGKYIFGGYRTSGYNSVEPAPFMVDKYDGHRINGTTLAPIATMLTGTVGNVPSIAAGDLLVNDVDVATAYGSQVTGTPATMNAKLTVAIPNANPVAAGDLLVDGAGTGAIAAGAMVNGLNMAKAWDAKSTLDGTGPLSVNVTTQYSSGVPVTGDTADGAASTINFNLNGVAVSVAVADGDNAATTAGKIVDAVNALKDQTGVEAVVGDGATNGATADEVVFRNTTAGDESAITVSGYGASGTADAGFADFTQAADNAHNTGEITLTGSSSFALSTLAGTDAVLNDLGLGGGGLGVADEANDGELIYGPRLAAGSLAIESGTPPVVTPVGAAADDGISTIYADTSAAAKAAAINAVNGATGVSATVVPASRQATMPVSGGTMNAGDLIINGQDIFALAGTTTISDADADGALADAINSVSATTGITAGTNAVGQLTLTAADGRNLAVETSANGDAVSHLNGGGVPESKVYFGSVTLSSADAFTLETTPTPSSYEPGLIALGLNGGATVSGVDGDVAGDGLLALPVGINLNQPTTQGLAMQNAFNLREALNSSAVQSQTGVTASLTTLSSSGIAVTGDAGVDGLPSTISFDLNGTTITAGIADGDSAATTAAKIVAAINAKSDQTGVEAAVGDGTNGGAANEIVFRNTLAGDESAIEVNNYTVNGEADAGFGNFVQAADATHNTGQISLTSADGAFAIGSDNYTDDTLLDLLGMGGGGVGFADEAGDGQLVYGPRLADDDLTVNGTAIAAATNDGLSDVYAASSAAAKANAINAVTDTTGVTATVVPASTQATAPVSGTAGYTPPSLDAGDLKINGVDIFDTATTIQEGDVDHALLDAINAKSDQTGVYATLNNTTLVLTAKDGRNIHVETSAKGEAVTSLTGGARDQVSFGSLQLSSGTEFMLETTPTTVDGYETGLATIGLDGGSSVTGEAGDTAGDGQIWVRSIANQEGSVRYNGDRDNNGEIKVSKGSTLEVTARGNQALSDTGVFTGLKALENALLGQGYTQVTSNTVVTDANALICTSDSGLDNPDQIVNGKFTVTVTDRDYAPPRDSAITIAVNPAYDTPQSMVDKLNGIPNLSASLDADGHIQIATSDPDRYTFSMTADDSGFLAAAGLDSQNVQLSALQNSITDMDQIMDSLTNNISDFGARANRIDVQSQILSNLELANTESLSEKQDTDITQALMDLQGKQFAYQAALAAASKTMKLSLVDYL